MKLVLHKEAVMLHLIFAVVTALLLLGAGALLEHSFRFFEWSEEGRHVGMMLWVILQVSPQIMYTEGGM
jgi:hypothetical protein